ncbi:MAG: glycerophosphodiester phosphodiesterase family protein, partial [Octadecabacter sp.]
MLKTICTLATVLLGSISSHANEPLIVAHRGASRDMPGNTIPAFQLAWKQGADAIEGDFHLSKDGE